MTAASGDRLILHASCVAVGQRGLLILGPSGSGKSGLALQMMALGAALIADDRVAVTREDGLLVARCPVPGIRGRIEARGLGILATPAEDAATLALAIDLGQTETDRLPPRRVITLLGMALDLVHGSQGSHLPAALLCYLRGGRVG